MGVNTVAVHYSTSGDSPSVSSFHPATSSWTIYTCYSADTITAASPNHSGNSWTNRNAQYRKNDF
jgi:hypothetical protein